MVCDVRTNHEFYLGDGPSINRKSESDVNIITFYRCLGRRPTETIHLAIYGYGYGLEIRSRDERPKKKKFVRKKYKTVYNL